MDKLNELEKKVSTFVKEREWVKFHTPKDIAVSISIEAAELLENFQWRDNEEIENMLKDAGYFSSVAEEMADVLIYLIALSSRLEVDLADIAFKKIKKNGEKYPIERFKGRARAPSF